MTITYKTNAAYTTQSLTEWYFGKSFVKIATKEAIKSGKLEYRTWQNGTGYLTVCITK